MFTPVGSPTTLRWTSAGSKTVVVPALATGVRVFTINRPRLAFNASTARNTDMSVQGAPMEPAAELFGVTAAQNLSIYGEPGYVVELTFGTITYP